ncbi:hypothetical protein HNQ08_003701 [Deinococcus humi]|uniref:Uncharacterized protein n=1 Tax=Deinococcus humi TaxID=662880 RepID=A0A7W8NH99_9DEIO|nr:hypothetical protein [Deinococcus humi]
MQCCSAGGTPCSRRLENQAACCPTVAL